MCLIELGEHALNLIFKWLFFVIVDDVLALLLLVCISVLLVTVDVVVLLLSISCIVNTCCDKFL